jgi:hypothetical protein
MPLRPIPPSLSIAAIPATTPSRPFLLNNLLTQIHKHLINIRPPSRTGLIIWFLAPTLRHLERSRPRNDPIILHVGFIADHDQRYILVVFDPDDLFAEFGEFVEGIHVADAEDEEEALTLFHVEFAHGGELLGAGCVEAAGMV